MKRMILTCTWTDGFGVRLHLARPQAIDAEVAWLFDQLREAYGR